MGKFGKWLFLFLVMGQNWSSNSTAAEGPQRRTEAVMRTQQEVRIQEKKMDGGSPKRWKQPKEVDQAEMKKEA